MSFHELKNRRIAEQPFTVIYRRWGTWTKEEATEIGWRIGRCHPSLAFRNRLFPNILVISRRFPERKLTNCLKRLVGEGNFTVTTCEGYDNPLLPFKVPAPFAPADAVTVREVPSCLPKEIQEARALASVIFKRR